METNLALLIVVLLLQVADVSTTIKAMARGATEANPLIADALKRYGSKGLLLIKLVASVVLVIAYATAVMEPYTVHVLGFLVALYLVVVGNNVRVLSAGSSRR